RLTAAEAQRLLVGRSVGDGAHWAYRFAADGSLELMDLGKTHPGRWRFVGGELCLERSERGKAQSDCYELRQSGKSLRFLRDGVPVLEGMLLDE
ncbi:MAG TPA: hypothetical protein VI279_16045, partial [Rhodocyclaceae bacterium]